MGCLYSTSKRDDADEDEIAWPATSVASTVAIATGDREASAAAAAAPPQLVLGASASAQPAEGTCPSKSTSEPEAAAAAEVQGLREEDIVLDTVSTPPATSAAGSQPLVSCVVTWGANECGQCMRGGSAAADGARCLSPEIVASLTSRRVGHLFAGYDCSLAITGTQRLYAAGNNSGRLLADSDSQEERSEECLRDVRHVGFDELEAYRFVAMSGGRDHLVAVTDAGAAVSWGRSNEFGQLGHGRSGTLSRVLPAPVNGLPTLYRVLAVACGEFSTLALLASGELYAWGYNQQGQLGVGDMEPRQQPSRLAGTASCVPFRAVAAGHQHSLALSGGGKVYAWGSNKHGQLGLGSEQQCDGACVLAPQIVLDIPFARHISGGGAHSAVLARKGRVLLAGDNRCGQLGLPRKDVMNSNTFKLLQGIGTSVRLVECGAQCTLCLTLDGQLYGFGGNGEGQLGIGVSSACEESPLPVQLSGGKTGEHLLVHSLVVTQDHACALALPLQRDQMHQLANLLPPADMHTSAVPCEKRGNPALAAPDDDLVSVDTVAGPLNSPLFASENASPMRRKRSVLKLQIPSLPPSSSKATSSTDPGDKKGGQLVELPLVQPGVASLEFLALGVDDLLSLAKAAEQSGDFRAPANALCAVLERPAVLNASFHIAGLREPRLDTSGLIAALEIMEAAPATLQVSVLQSAEKGASAFGAPDALAGLQEREQLRGVLVYLMLPQLRHASVPQGPRHALLSQVSLLLARLAPRHRRSLLEVLMDEMPHAAILRDCCLPAVRSFVNERIKLCKARGLPADPALWNASLLMQLLYVANQQLRDRQMVELRAHGASKATLGHRFLKQEEFQLDAFNEDLVPPLVAYRQLAELIDINAMVVNFPSPSDLLCSDRSVYEEEKGSLPKFMTALMVHRNLVPVAFKQKVLQISNSVKQQSLMKGLIGPREIIGMLQGEDTLPRFPLTVRRSSIVEDTVSKLRSADPAGLRLPLRITFEGEEGLDVGGVRREFFQVLLRQLFDESYAMFVRDSSFQTTWFDLSAPESEDTNDMYRVCGIVIGLAIYNNEDGIQVHFPLALFKKLKGEELDNADLEDVNPTVWRSLQQVMAWIPTSRNPDKEFEDTFGLTFTASYDYFGESRTVDLKPGGADTAVKFCHRQEYIDLYCAWLLGESVERQFKHLREGFSMVVNSSLWSLLTAEEARLMLCSEIELDITELRKGTEYDGYSGSEACISWFWDVLESFDEAQRKRFLAFTTGCDRAPLGGLKDLRLMVQRDRATGAAKRLPTSHTCFNTLVLPEYGDKDQLRVNLLTAIENSEGFGLE